MARSKIRKLQDALRYRRERSLEGEAELPTVSVRSTPQEIKAAKKAIRDWDKKSENRQLIRASDKWNDRVGDTTRASRQKIVLTPESALTLGKKRTESLLKAVRQATRNSNKQSASAKLAEAFRRTLHTNKAPESVSGLSRWTENLARARRGLRSLEDQRYYHNFLLFCARTGAWTLFRRAQKNGIDWVIDLYNRGFEIAEGYSVSGGKYESTGVNYWTDEMVAAEFDGVEPEEYNAKNKRDSEQGKRILASIPRKGQLYTGLRER